MIYVIFFSNLGEPALLLSPEIDIYKKVSDGSDVASPPALSEIGGGFYKFTAAPAEALLARIDGGATLTAPDRYKVLQITPNDANLDQALSATEDNIRGAGSDTLETLGNQIEALPVLAEIEASAVLAKQAEVLRALGLMQENFYLDTPVYNTNGLLTGCRLRLYSIAGSVGTDNDVLAIYQITSTYQGTRRQTYQVVKQ